MRVAGELGLALNGTGYAILLAASGAVASGTPYLGRLHVALLELCGDDVDKQNVR
jgi:hypothetical protein